jgi:hypothetical protein
MTAAGAERAKARSVTDRDVGSSAWFGWGFTPHLPDEITARRVGALARHSAES